MRTIPIYDLLVLPGVTFFFKKDMFPNQEITSENEGEDVLFLLLKSEKSREDLTKEDFYSLGVSGKIENIDGEGNVRIRIKERVEVSDIEVSADSVSASAIICSDVDDISDEEERERFEKLKKDLMKFAQGFQWGVWARGFILHWKNINEVACALSGYFNLTWDEKYAMMETSSRKHRCDLIEKAVYELMEVFKVSEEAENAQKETNDKVYREEIGRAHV